MFHLIQKKARGKRLLRHFNCQTDVTLYPIDKEDLHRYVESGDPLDKAGAYGIQGVFSIHVKGIKGDYNNVGRASDWTGISGTEIFIITPTN